MENQSSILVTLNEVTVRLLQLDPWPQGILDRKALLDSKHVSYEWPYIEERTAFYKDVDIEPGESESYHFDFIIDCQIQSIIVYSYVENLSKKNIGWNLSTTHDIMPKEEKMNHKRNDQEQ